jgi:predicted secreted hydrolase
MRRCIALLALVGVAAWPAGAAPLRTANGFLNANVPWHFVFPRDHAAHDGFASEWWYYTGHVRARDGRRFGYELTFFRFGLRPGAGAPKPGQSAWRGNQFYPAHLALTDESGGRFVHFERFARAALGAGSASTTRLDVHADDWSLTGPNPFHLVAGAGDIAIDFRETSEKPPAIHGHDGISTKAACETCASHYYSMTRLRTTGTLTVDGARLPVEGISWMDHEFGSAELQANQAGWDWFSIQLDDRRELMLYLLRQPHRARRIGDVSPAFRFPRRGDRHVEVAAHRRCLPERLARHRSACERRPDARADGARSRARQHVERRLLLGRRRRRAWPRCKAAGRRLRRAHRLRGNRQPLATARTSACRSR